MSRILLVSTYDLGRQPFGLASPAAWLREAGHRCRLPRRDTHQAGRISDSRREPHRLLPPDAHRDAHGAPVDRSRADAESVGTRGGLWTVCTAQRRGAPRAWHRDGARAGIRTGSAGARRQGRRCVRRWSRGRLAGRRADTTSAHRVQDPDRSDLPPLARYATLQAGERTKIVGYTEASRGCKHRCRHCPIVPVYDGRFRAVPVDVVLADIASQVRRGAEHITFGDPDFLNGPTPRDGPRRRPLARAPGRHVRRDDQSRAPAQPS